MKWIRIRVSNLDDNLSRVIVRHDEKRIRIEDLEVELDRVRDDVIMLIQDNIIVMQQRNICCQLARRL